MLSVLGYAQGYLPFEALVVAGSIDGLLVVLCWLELNS
jgi:hypothetical protein